MKKLLIVAATQLEIEPLLKVFGPSLPQKQGGINSFNFKNQQIDVLITGVGMVNTAFAMGSLNSNNYFAAINMGVCGSFNKEIKIGELVNITQDCFSELGAQNKDEFLTLTQLNLGNEIVSVEIPFEHSLIHSLKKVKSITVNTVHGNVLSIQEIKTRLNPDVESMEGAAFLLACNNLQLPALQIRTVSNKVEQRNKENWNMPLAIENLNTFLIQFLDSL